MHFEMFVIFWTYFELNVFFFKQKEQMQRHICALQISRICGSHLLNAEHLSALYTAFTLHYEHGLNALTPDSLPTDIPIADAYALLAGELGHSRQFNFLSIFALFTGGGCGQVLEVGKCRKLHKMSSDSSRPYPLLPRWRLCRINFRCVETLLPPGFESPRAIFKKSKFQYFPWAFRPSGSLGSVFTSRFD